jgi:hypothetical protein
MVSMPPMHATMPFCRALVILPTTGMPTPVQETDVARAANTALHKAYDHPVDERETMLNRVRSVRGRCQGK